jgi:hypothetical protein
VRRNLVEAWAWFSLSDDERAVKWREGIAEQFTTKQRARAQARLEELRSSIAAPRS